MNSNKIETSLTFEVKVRDLETGKNLIWTLTQVLEEINRDRSKDWTDYDVSDWREGWREWVEGDYFTLVRGA